MKHIPRKRFGQNFLIDDQIITDIVNAVAAQPDSRVVEIGPGLGALTRPLLDRIDHLHVVEIDRDIVARLQRQFRPERLTIHQGDALAYDFGALATELGGPLKIVGNLPYNISTPLLFHLAGFAEQVIDMHFMLQKEVVERMVAAPGDSENGRLSIMLQYRFDMEWLIDVPPESFDPPPKVDSAVVRMMPRPVSELGAADAELLSRVVAAAFSQRRKMIRNTLKGIADEATLIACDIAPTARAEDLGVADFVRLTNYLHQRRG
jgi:16S rRNA (adenine1518-N6/adenine1519-N6)-dimethyltransferase